MTKMILFICNAILCDEEMKIQWSQKEKIYTGKNCVRKPRRCSLVIRRDISNSFHGSSVYMMREAVTVRTHYTGRERQRENEKEKKKGKKEREKDIELRVGGYSPDN